MIDLPTRINKKKNGVQKENPDWTICELPGQMGTLLGLLKAEESAPNQCRHCLSTNDEGERTGFASAIAYNPDLVDDWQKTPFKDKKVFIRWLTLQQASSVSVFSRKVESAHRLRVTQLYQLLLRYRVPNPKSFIMCMAGVFLDELAARDQPVMDMFQKIVLYIGTTFFFGRQSRATTKANLVVSGNGGVGKSF